MRKKEIVPNNDAPPDVDNQQVGVEEIIDYIKQKSLLQTSVAQSAIANSIYLASIITDIDGLIQGFNLGAERMLGYESTNVINQLSMILVIDAEEISARAQALTIEFATPTPMMPDFSALVYKATRGHEDIYEMTYMHQDGSRVPAMVSVMALHDIDHLQDIIGYLFIGTDNSARKLIELERRNLLNIQQEMNGQLQRTNIILRRGEEKLAVILSSIGDAVMATDDQAQVTFLNPVAEHLTGWTHEEAIGRPVSDIFHIINKENRQIATIPILKTLANGTKQGLANHTILIARDGSEHDIADSCAPINDRDDEVVGAVLVFRDVTKEYAGQQSLSDKTKMIQTILNTMVDGVISFDAQSYVIKTANPAAERIFGYHQGELIGLSFNVLIPEFDQNQDYYSLDCSNAEASAAGLSREVVGMCKQGNPFATEIAVSQMSLNNQCYFTCILRDITERKSFEKALNDKNIELENAIAVAEKANLAKSNFLSSMSHELRTPLNAILGFAQLLEASAPQLEPTQKRRMDQILKAGWYLLDLINEILDLALIESGKLALSIEPMSLTEVLRECQAMIEPQAQKYGIHLTFPVIDAQCLVEADRTRVKQVIINLLSNAIKYNRKDGTVVVTCTRSDADRIRIGVENSGEGLSADQLAQLFQPFNRLGQEAKSEEGTGIGLVVCKQLMELMGGVIGVESTVGESSLFWIELNLVPEQPAIAHSSSTHTKNHHTDELREKI